MRVVQHRLAITLLASVIAGSGCAGPQTATSLDPRRGAAQVQTRLEQALSTLPGWRLQRAGVQQGHEVLVLTPSSAAPGGPVCLVDTQASAKDQSELAIQIRVDPLMEIPKAGKARVLDLINAHHEENWAGTFFVDAQGSLLGQWTLNLPKQALDVAFVKDAIQRLYQSWLQLDSELRR